MFELKKETSQALQTVMWKADIEEVWIYWYKMLGAGWNARIEYKKDDMKMEKKFRGSSLEEVLKALAEFSEKVLLVEIK